MNIDAYIDVAFHLLNIIRKKIDEGEEVEKCSNHKEVNDSKSTIDKILKILIININ